jgi:hypothetical protein
LAAEDSLATAGAADGWGGLQRFSDMKPSAMFVISTAIGLALVLGLYGARLRWAWWPLHPVVFMVWGSNVSARLYGSFLAGWLAKTLITRFAGATGYRRARPFFIGMISGEVAVGLMWMIVGAIHYAYVGQPGATIRSHP